MNTSKNPSIYFPSLAGDSEAKLSLPDIIRNSGKGPNFNKVAELVEKELTKCYNFHSDGDNALEITSESTQSTLMCTPAYVWIYKEGSSRSTARKVKISKKTIDVSDLLTTCHSDFCEEMEGVSSRELFLKNEETDAIIDKSEKIIELNWNDKTYLILCISKQASDSWLCRTTNGCSLA